MCEGGERGAELARFACEAAREPRARWAAGRRERRRAPVISIGTAPSQLLHNTHPPLLSRRSTTGPGAQYPLLSLDPSSAYLAARERESREKGTYSRHACLSPLLHRLCARPELAAAGTLCCCSCCVGSLRPGSRTTSRGVVLLLLLLCPLSLSAPAQCRPSRCCAAVPAAE